MDNQNALNVLFQAASIARLTAEEHQQVQVAAKQLQEFIAPKEDKKDGK